MKINYTETTSDLQTRINIHDTYGGRNIDEWMLSILPLHPGAVILDVGCGSGKQCFSYYNHLHGDANITGGDVSEDLLSQARDANHQVGDAIHFVNLDFNQKFQFPDNTFDLVSCCFAIYYAEDVPFTIRDMHRVIKPGGTLFTSGPMPENKQVFYDVIKEATHKTIPPMPGSSRYSTEFLTTMKNTFSKVEVKIFENPLTFTEPEPFLAYTRASLSEDRKLWGDFFQQKGDFEKIMAAIEEVVRHRIEKEGKLVMTKVVGGFLATK